MSRDEERSVTEWIGDLKAGDDGEAARHLWERYFTRLAHLAHAHLRATPRGPADGEDVALSAFESFFRGAAAGRFPRLDDREDLWKLLTTIVARKAANQRRREHQKKRGGGRVVAGADLAADPAGGDPLAQIACGEPTPEFAAFVADEVRRRFDSLADESRRIVARLRMEGYANDEIAEALDISLRSVERKLELIRKAWLREGCHERG
jgi:DNA-directed RNA polymerase specialized sigma24 family protein